MKIRVQLVSDCFAKKVSRLGPSREDIRSRDGKEELRGLLLKASLSLLPVLAVSLILVSPWTSFAGGSLSRLANDRSEVLPQGQRDALLAVQGFAYYPESEANALFEAFSWREASHQQLTQVVIGSTGRVLPIAPDLFFPRTVTRYQFPVSPQGELTRILEDLRDLAKHHSAFRLTSTDAGLSLDGDSLAMLLNLDQQLYFQVTEQIALRKVRKVEHELHPAHVKRQHGSRMRSYISLLEQSILSRKVSESEADFLDYSELAQLQSCGLSRPDGILLSILSSVESNNQKDFIKSMRKFLRQASESCEMEPSVATNFVHAFATLFVSKNFSSLAEAQIYFSLILRDSE